VSGAAAGVRDRTLLAFDFGTYRIGVAVGQTVTGTATPLATVRVRNATPDWQAITRMIEEWRPDALVVGLPLRMDGDEQPMSRVARRFGRQLEGRYRLPVHMADERLSTKEARSRMVAARQKLERADDPMAARVILEGWLMGISDPCDE